MPTLAQNKTTAAKAGNTTPRNLTANEIAEQKFQLTCDLIRFFYPGDNVLPRTVVSVSDIADIMNYDRAAANKLMREIRQSLAREQWDVVLVTEFCAYMELDEYFVQLFLYSLHN
jgi:hypothetical protein